MSEILLKINNVHHGFGALPVLYDVNLEIARGHIVGLVGPSGCGKSTLLRAIIGTHPPNTGTVSVCGKEVEGPSRERGVVYQHYSLFPFLTALENVAFGPLLDQTSYWFRIKSFFKWRKLRKAHLEEARALLERFGLGQALHRYPSQLSGGMKQRVAIAQALIMKPELLVLDEPFGALDEATREDLQDMLVELYNENLTAQKAGKKPPYTIIIVTHELNEALYVSNRVVGLSQYWKHEEENFEKTPGATVIYDVAAPITDLDQARDPEKFVAQRHEIREIVFATERRRQRNENVRFWNEAKAKGAAANPKDPKADEPKAKNTNEKKDQEKSSGEKES
jgi:NitT/TauT family transport system ATP-binding protein